MAIVLDGTSGITAPSVIGTPVRGGLVSGTAVASTSGTSIDFTGIPSWVKRITVMFAGVSTNGTSRTIIQLGDSGGFETTGYLGASTVAGSATPASTAFTDGFGINFFAAGNLVHGSMVISLLDASANTWVNSHVFGLSDGAFIVTGGASKSLSAALTQIRITTQAGTNTFDAGTINIIYEG